MFLVGHETERKDFVFMCWLEAGGDRCLLWQFILLFFSLLSRGGLKAHSSKHF